MLITPLSVGFIQSQQSGYGCTTTLPLSSTINPDSKNLHIMVFTTHKRQASALFFWKVVHCARTDVQKARISTATLFHQASRPRFQCATFLEDGS